MILRKDNQKGFGAIEVTLMIIIVLAIIALAYYIYNANRNINSTYKSATTISNAPAPKFTRIKNSPTASVK